MRRRRSSLDEMREEVRHRRENRRPEADTRMPAMSKQNQIKAFIFALVALGIGLAALVFQGLNAPPAPVPDYGNPPAVSPEGAGEEPAGPERAGQERAGDVRGASV